MSTVGHKIARTYFNWNNLTRYEEAVKFPEIEQLAKLINEHLPKDQLTEKHITT